MRKGKKIAAIFAAALFISAVPATTFADVVKYSPERTAIVNEPTGLDKSGISASDQSAMNTMVEVIKTLIEVDKKTIEDIKQMGPSYETALKEYLEQKASNLGTGIQVQEQEAFEEESTSSFNGPSITKVDLTQFYHETYKIYELSMADQYFLYSTVGNGGITHEPVMIDIPANVAYTMEKDGNPYEYVSKQYIYEKGTYVMKLMGIENKDAPLSEQKEYQATFRFRIQDEPPAEESEAAPENSLGGNVNSLWGNTSIPTIVAPTTEPVVETEPAIESEPETEPVKETEVPETEPVDVLTGRDQSYERVTGSYIITFENGKQLTTTVPEGYVGAATVTLSVAEGDEIATKLYKNDEPIDFVNNNPISEFGRYRVEMDGSSYFFTLAYEVGQMDYYPAPVGMKFKEVRLDDEALTLASDQYAQMEEDGIYTFVMTGDDGERFEVLLKKDTVAPEVNVTTAKSSAAIQYLSDDIAKIELLKDGKVISGFAGTSISEPGNYTLMVTDGAGNSTSASFSLKYQVNVYGILAVVLVILTITGIGGFVVYTKKNTKVR